MTLRVPISYAVGLALAVSLTGCSTDDETGSGRDATTRATSASSTSSTSTAPAEASTSVSPPPSTTTPPASDLGGRTLEVIVTGRQVEPAPSTVSLGVGDRLTLVVTSDHDDTLHIHGFDVEKPLTAGRATSVTLTGKQPGVYEVETHHPELRLLKIAVK